MSLLSRYRELPFWCTPEQAARFLGVSQHLVYKLLGEGRIPCAWRTSAHGRWNISRDSLAALVGLSVEMEETHVKS